MSFSPLFYVNSVFCMCVVCLLSFVYFNKIFYPKTLLIAVLNTFLCVYLIMSYNEYRIGSDVSLVSLMELHRRFRKYSS